MEFVNAFPVKSDIKRALDKKTTLSKLERKMLDSCGTSGTGETPQARLSAPRRLTARPAESEHLERKFTPIQSLIVRKIELLNAKAFKSGFIFVLREKRVS
ncbi:hypothetical protein [Guptibacillus hwajinpoensis]|uniref:Uncharacterized protein n=1 Tax=Guptibacillus hwajinpoensis TaxID=208199 RepID=A0ABU0JYV7_9BACL|nr:hypothetical protein [Alkalihalobacillus hemicentroti]MDQ0482272.1 hypothetical protein [Alkalihalobacillus hemicentroti]